MRVPVFMPGLFGECTSPRLGVLIPRLTTGNEPHGSAVYLVEAVELEAYLLGVEDTAAIMPLLGEGGAECDKVGWEGGVVHAGLFGGTTGVVTRIADEDQCRETGFRSHSSPPSPASRCRRRR